MRILLLFFIFLVTSSPATEAKPRACTNSELQAGLTDNMVIGCTGKGGSVKCDSNGTVLCCKKLAGGGELCVTESNLQFLRVKPPEATKPPSAGGAGEPQGKIRP
jgi:hypothetical protein